MAQIWEHHSAIRVLGVCSFIQTVMWHLSMGNTIGGFDIERPARVLYLDYEPILKACPRACRSKTATAIQAKSTGTGQRLSSSGRRRRRPWDARGQQPAQDWITSQSRGGRIDTLRSAWRVSKKTTKRMDAGQLRQAIRNTGRAVIMIHHATKAVQTVWPRSRVNKPAHQPRPTDAIDADLEDAERADQFNGLVDKPDNLGETMTQQLTRKAGELSNGSLLDAYRLTYHKTRDRNENMRRFISEQASARTALSSSSLKIR